MKPYPFRSEAARARYLAVYDERARAWPVPSTTRMVDTSFGQTFVRISGPEDAPPLVLLPGISSPGHSLASNAVDLAARHRVFAVDNIHDVGRSVELASRPVTSMDDFVAWLDELFTQLGFTAPVDLLGLSYGGCLSANFALKHPARVRRLVLLAPAGILAPIPWGFIWRAVLSLLPGKYFLRNFMSWVSNGLGSRPEHRRFLDEMVDDAYVALHAFQRRPMVPPMPLSDAQWKALSVPTLLIAGDLEVNFPAAASFARVKALVPSMEQVLLAGAGHDLFVTRAAEVDRAALEFLER